MSGWSTGRIEELDRIPVEHGLEWRPIRRRFGIRSFGINAYTSSRVGGWVVEEHDESSGHEEIYLVVTGRATFTLDDEMVDAPAGTAIFLPEGAVKRKAITEEEGTTVLAIGGWPDKVFVPSAWEWVFEAYAKSPEEGIAILHEGRKELGDSPNFDYHLACLETKAGRLDEARAHLASAIAAEPELQARANADEDLAPLRTTPSQ